MSPYANYGSVWLICVVSHFSINMVCFVVHGGAQISHLEEFRLSFKKER